MICTVLDVGMSLGSFKCASLPMCFAAGKAVVMQPDAAETYSSCVIAGGDRQGQSGVFLSSCNQSWLGSIGDKNNSLLGPLLRPCLCVCAQPIDVTRYLCRLLPAERTAMIQDLSPCP